MDSVAILIPLLRRPHRVAPVLESATAGTPEAHQVLFICSPNDLESIREVRNCGLEPLIMPKPNYYGDYAMKINAGIRETSDPWVFTGADDLHFWPGWFTSGVNCGGMFGARVVGTTDLCNPRVTRGEHATHFLVHRSYIEELGTIDEPGKFFHEGYWHECVDDEAVATAIHREEFVVSSDSVVEHLHPMAGKAPMDALYRQQGQRIVFGRRILRQRQHLWK